MTIIPASLLESCQLLSGIQTKRLRDARGRFPAVFLFLLVFFLCSSWAPAQGKPKITGVDPASAKVNDSVTVSGEALGKDTVVGIFLSDEKSDYKASIVTQAADKIVIKVPQVKAGSYNVSIQVGTGILIEPVKFTVQE